MAWLLVMLKDLNLHGYEIMRALKENYDVVSDPGTVYRALRQLERDGYISSWWDPKEQGPARRMYTLTESGGEAIPHQPRRVLQPLHRDVGERPRAQTP
jgi:poly-beta-hydroxybutyrate-responsive repressor